MAYNLNDLEQALDNVLQNRINLNNLLEKYIKNIKQFEDIDLKKQKWKSLEDIEKDSHIKKNIFIHGDLQTKETEDKSQSRYNSGIVIINKNCAKNSAKNSDKNNQQLYFPNHELVFSDIHGDYGDLEIILNAVLEHLNQGGVVINCGDSILELSTQHRKMTQCQPFKTAIALLLLQLQYPNQFICLIGNHDREDCINGFKSTKKALSASMCDEYISYYVYSELLSWQIIEVINKNKKYNLSDKKIIEENLKDSLNEIIKKNSTVFEKFIFSQNSETSDLCNKQANNLKDISNEQKKYLAQELELQINLRRSFIMQYKNIYDPPKNKQQKLQQNPKQNQETQKKINALLKNFKEDKKIFYECINKFPEIAISLNTKTIYVHASIPKITEDTKFTEILSSKSIEDFSPGNSVTTFSPNFHYESWKNLKQFGFNCCCKGHDHGNMLNGAKIFSKENKLEFTNINDTNINDTNTNEVNTVFSCSFSYKHNSFYKQFSSIKIATKTAKEINIQKEKSENDNNKKDGENKNFTDSSNKSLFFPQSLSMSSSTSNIIINIENKNDVEFPCIMINSLQNKKLIPLNINIPSNKPYQSEENKNNINDKKIEEKKINYN